MPNYVHNKVQFHCSTKRYNEMMKQLYTKRVDPAYELSFNWIVPEPQNFEECPPQFLKNDDSIQELENRPWFDWYKWHNAMWGTKWDASDVITRDCEWEFDTAWATPLPIYQKLSKLFPGIAFTVNFADEDTYSNNCGTFEYAGKKQALLFIAPDHPHTFAREIWGYEYDDE